MSASSLQHHVLEAVTLHLLILVYSTTLSRNQRPPSSSDIDGTTAATSVIEKKLPFRRSLLTEGTMPLTDVETSMIVKAVRDIDRVWKTLEFHLPLKDWGASPLKATRDRWFDSKLVDNLRVSSPCDVKLSPQDLEDLRGLAGDLIAPDMSNELEAFVRSKMATVLDDKGHTAHPFNISERFNKEVLAMSFVAKCVTDASVILRGQFSENSEASFGISYVGLGNNLSAQSLETALASPSFMETSTAPWVDSRSVPMETQRTFIGSLIDSHGFKPVHLSSFFADSCRGLSDIANEMTA